LNTAIGEELKIARVRKCFKELVSYLLCIAVKTDYIKEFYLTLGFRHATGVGPVTLNEDLFLQFVFIRPELRNCDTMFQILKLINATTLETVLLKQ
jgi:hypothetical protein